MSSLPKYAKEKMKGNIGEAFVQYILSQFCLVHSIDGSNDIGNDFICELIKDQSPTNLLFYVQVKYTKRKPVIRRELKEYWKGSPIPVFIFWVKDAPSNPPNLDKFDPSEPSRVVEYMRATPVVHNERRHKGEGFNPYEEIEFKKDLIVDYARSLYNAGFAPVISPRDYLEIDEKIIMRLSRHLLFVDDVIPEYEESILNRSWSTFYVTATLLKRKRTENSLRKAREALRLARELLEESDVSERGLFLEILGKEVAEVDNLLNNLNGRNQ